ALASLLIDELDENGYLPTPLQEMAQSLPAELNIRVDELQTALRLVQSFDPAGVGATSLSECLILQMADKDGVVQNDVLACARSMARQHLELLGAGRIDRLREALSCSMDELRQA